MNPHTNSHVQRLQVTLGAQSVGMLAMAPKGAIVFEYSTDWVAHGFDIAPKSLAFNTQPQLAKSPLFGGLHGVFNDSLPDGWGLLLMDRALGQRMGWARQHITPLDRLAYMGTRAMGALGYAPEMDTAPIEDTVNLAQLAASVEQVLAGDTAAVLAQLRIQGGSPGGARPKTRSTWAALKKPMRTWRAWRASTCPIRRCATCRWAAAPKIFSACGASTAMPTCVTT
jgi:serine/threonine-protein kinase HipA